MSTKEPKQPKKRTSRTSNVQGSKNAKKNPPPKKVSISFHKFTISILEATMADLEEIRENSHASLKEAMGFLLDIGSLGYKSIKAKQQQEVERIIAVERVKKKAEEKEKKVKKGKKVVKKEAVAVK